MTADEPVEGPRLVCFVCGAPTEPVSKDMPYQPYQATVFYTQGHYGSTVFDTMMDRSLEIAICDAHLAEHASRVLHVSPGHAVQPEPIRKVWNPEEDYR